MKQRTKIILIVAAALVAGVLVVVANTSRMHSQVRDVNVQVRYGKQPVLVAEADIRDTILKHLPKLLQEQVRDVDCEAVAEVARTIPSLCDVSAQTSVSGKVVVKARQRRPIARLFYGSKEFYFDNQGVLFPVGRLSDCDVLVVGGNFTEPLRTDSIGHQLQQLVTVATFLDDNRDYKSLIDQLYIERDGDIIMVPKLGNHVVELGTTERLDIKCQNLMVFYRKGMPRAGWDTYSKISLKFNGQVVATKRKV